LQRAIKGIEREQEKERIEQCQMMTCSVNNESDNGDYRQNNKNQKYDILLAEAVKLGKAHHAKAKEYVPAMYEILVKKEGVAPADAADRIYKDLVGIWQKDTIRRLLPPETKDQAARERQAVSRLKMKSDAGLILRRDLTAVTYDDNDNKPNSSYNNNNNNIQRNNTLIVELQQENAKLKREIEELSSFKKLYYSDRIIPQRRQEKQKNVYDDCKEQQLQQSDLIVACTQSKGVEDEERIIVLPPRLFMKTFTILRSCSRPINLKVKHKEVVDVDILKE
jgi:hypothetical protein